MLLFIFIYPDRTKMEFMIGGRRHCVTKQDLENALSNLELATLFCTNQVL
jgi:hypothetical protein